MFEEKGHGGSIIRDDVKDIIALDASPIGEGHLCCEDKIILSPCFGGICNRELTKKLLIAPK